MLAVRADGQYRYRSILLVSCCPISGRVSSRCWQATEWQNDSHVALSVRFCVLLALSSVDCLYKYLLVCFILFDFVFYSNVLNYQSSTRRVTVTLKGNSLVTLRVQAQSFIVTSVLSIFRIIIIIIPPLFELQ